uniref:Uncharacterized protein n=1 Tax=Anguilla anguilla TaxID=7936 RepID=A0A0E9PX82_ANGAN
MSSNNCRWGKHKNEQIRPLRVKHTCVCLYILFFP